MHRLHVPAHRISHGSATTDENARAYLHDVLRLKVGASLEVFDGEGRAYPAVLERYGDGEAVLSLGEAQERPFAGVRVTLLQGMPKADKLELIIQKSVELGVSRIVPVEMERSVVRLDERKAQERVTRWQKIADEAARQCGRADVVTIAPVVNLSKALASTEGVRLVLDEEEKQMRLRTVLTDPNAAYAFLVGPEGGITRDEVEQARRAGFRPVTLGPRVLRTETVALATLAVLQHVLGDLG